MKKLVSLALSLTLCLTAILFTAACSKKDDDKTGAEGVYSEAFLLNFVDSYYGEPLTIKGYNGDNYTYGSATVTEDGSFNYAAYIQEGDYKDFVYSENNVQYTVSVNDEGKTTYRRDAMETTMGMGMSSIFGILETESASIISALPKKDVQLFWKAVVDNCLDVSENGDEVTLTVNLDKIAAFADRILHSTIKDAVNAVFGDGYYDSILEFVEFACNGKIKDVLAGLKDKYGFDVDKIISIVAKVSGAEVSQITDTIDQMGETTVLEALSAASKQQITYEQIRSTIDQYAAMKIDALANAEDVRITKKFLLDNIAADDISISLKTNKNGKLLSGKVRVEYTSRTAANKDEYDTGTPTTREEKQVIDMTLDRSVPDFSAYGYRNLSDIKSEVEAAYSVFGNVSDYYAYGYEGTEYVMNYYSDNDRNIGTCISEQTEYEINVYDYSDSITKNGNVLTKTIDRYVRNVKTYESYSDDVILTYDLTTRQLNVTRERENN